MRKVIQISDGVYLCNDGTMWKIVNGSQGRKTWAQIPDVPQPQPQPADVKSEIGMVCGVSTPKLNKNIELYRM